MINDQYAAKCIELIVSYLSDDSLKILWDANEFEDQYSILELVHTELNRRGLGEYCAV
jgi:hypothetical protein